MIQKALTIAGSDSSGGAGIQADLKTFSALKVYGMSVITALTAQNTTGVSDILEIDAAFVGRQFDAVIGDLPPDAAKTGMLLTPAIVEVVAAKVREYQIAQLVVDTVMIGKTGSQLLRIDALEELRRSLLPLALVLTPNTEEAEVLTGHPVSNLHQMKEAAKRIHAMGPKNVLMKGGHLDGDAIDVLFDGSEFIDLPHERIPTNDTHGTGCVLSSAITAYLARGEEVREAVRLGKVFVTQAIRNSLRIGSGRGPCDPVGLRAGPAGA